MSASTSSASGGWTTGNFTLLAETPAINITYPDAPTQIHLALSNITGWVDTFVVLHVLLRADCRVVARPHVRAARAVWLPCVQAGQGAMDHDQPYTHAKGEESCKEDVVLQGCYASLGHIQPSLLSCLYRFSMAQLPVAPTPAQLSPPQILSPLLNCAEALPTAQATSIQASAGQLFVSTQSSCHLSSCVPCSSPAISQAVCPAPALGDAVCSRCRLCLYTLVKHGLPAGILNTATMQNLTASTTYYYRVGDSVGVIAAPANSSTSGK